jgi:hypothetical protein
MIEQIFTLIRSLPEYQNLLGDLQTRGALGGLGFRRSARTPLLASLHADLDRPILFITDRSDRAARFLDELLVWAADEAHLLFAEPTQLFYEHGAWGSLTRRSRIQCLAALSGYHLPSYAVYFGETNSKISIEIIQKIAGVLRT